MSDSKYKNKKDLSSAQVVKQVINSPAVKSGITEINDINKRINELKPGLANKPDIWNRVFNSREYNEMDFLQSNLRASRSQLQTDIMTGVNNATNVYSVEKLHKIADKVVLGSKAIQHALGEIGNPFREARERPEILLEQTQNEQIKEMAMRLRGARVTDITSVRLGVKNEEKLLEQSDLLEATNAGRKIREDEIAIVIANKLKLPQKEILKRMKELNV